MQGGIFLCSIAVIISIFLLTNKKAVYFIAKLFNINQENSEQFTENLQELFQNYLVIGYAFLLSLVYYLVAYLLGYLIILAAGFNYYLSSNYKLYASAQGANTVYNIFK